MNTEDRLTRVINSSGFPLQIGLARQVEETTSRHGWRVLFQEHSWKHEENETSGFIDLILESQSRTQLMVIECKRVLQSEWIFLVPGTNNSSRAIVKPWVNYEPSDDYWYRGWFQASAAPHSPISSFCVVHGQTSNEKPMLERVASSLIESTEAFALEEFELRDRHDSLRMYTSIIVTTAEIKVGEFDPKNISLSDGTISSAKFSQVPFIRFHKQLSNDVANTFDLAGKDYSALSRIKERQVFVVNAESFLEFLELWEPNDQSLGPLFNLTAR